MLLQLRDEIPHGVAVLVEHFEEREGANGTILEIDAEIYFQTGNGSVKAMEWVYVNEETIGELLMYFMYDTAFAGALLNIDAYNQPGVEEGKKATFAMLGRTGYEAKLAEVNAVVKNDKFII